MAKRKPLTTTSISESTLGHLEDKPLTPSKPTMEPTPTEPPSPKVLKQEPAKGPSPDTEFMPTPMKTIGQIADAVRAGTASPEELKFTNRPEVLAEGGWILPEGFTPAAVGERPFGSNMMVLDGGQFIQSAQPRDFIPEGEHSYAVMAQYYPEMFEDPKLAPLQQELAESEARLKAKGISTAEAPITDEDLNVVRAQYDSEAFEQQLIQTLGVNPYQMNPMGEMNYRWKAEGPALFNEVFQGTVRWGDRSKLNKEEMAYWNQQRRQWRAETYKMLNDMRSAKIAEYENAMGNFASRAKNHATALELRKAEQKEASKMPDYKKLPDGKGNVTLWYWDKKKRKLVDSGQKATLTDADLTPQEKSIGSLVSKLKGSQIQNETAQLILAQNPELADDPTIQAMLGGPQNPDIKKAVEDGQAYLAKMALRRIEAAQVMAAKKGDAAPVTGKEPTAKEVQESLKDAPEKVREVPQEDGDPIPIYAFSESANYEDGQIVEFAATTGNFHVVVGENKTESFQTEEDAIKFVKKMKKE
jgi:hypothetical protein